MSLPVLEHSTHEPSCAPVVIERQREGSVVAAHDSTRRCCWRSRRRGRANAFAQELRMPNT